MRADNRRLVNCWISSSMYVSRHWFDVLITFLDLLSSAEIFLFVIVNPYTIQTHPAVNKMKELAQAKGVNHFVYLNNTLKQAQQDKKAPFMTYLTKDYYLSVQNLPTRVQTHEI